MFSLLSGGGHGWVGGIVIEFVRVIFPNRAITLAAVGDTFGALDARYTHACGGVGKVHPHLHAGANADQARRGTREVLVPVLI